MLVINIIAALMGIAAAGACAVLAGRPAGVGKNGTAFFWAKPFIEQCFPQKKHCRHSKNEVRSSTFPQNKDESRPPDFERCGEQGERAELSFS